MRSACHVRRIAGCISHPRSRSLFHYALVLNLREDVCKFVAEQAIAQKEALKKGLEVKSYGLTEKDSELCRKA